MDPTNFVIINLLVHIPTIYRFSCAFTFIVVYGVTWFLAKLYVCIVAFG